MAEVTDRESGKTLVIPVNASEQSLSFALLKQYFPGADGLEFKLYNKDTAVAFDESMSKLVQPICGWSAKSFYVVRHHVPTASIKINPALSVSGRLESPYAAPRSPPPMASSVVQWMFYVNEETETCRSCVVCIHPRYFVTFRHGIHRKLQINDSLTIHRAESVEKASYKVTVVRIDDCRDFILLKSEQNVVEKGPKMSYPETSESFLLAGFAKKQQNLSFLTGIVHDRQRYYRSGTEDDVLGPFILGAGLSSSDYPGGACWGPDGLIGINIGFTAFDRSAIDEGAGFNPKNYMVPSIFFEAALSEEIYETNNQPPQSKKARREMLLERIDDFEMVCDSFKFV